jgi:hypothetical protein
MASLQDRIFRHHEASFIAWARAGCPSIPSMAGSHLPRLFLRKPRNSAPEKSLPADAAFKIRTCKEANNLGNFKNEQGQDRNQLDKP